MTKVLICGDRNYSDRDTIRAWLCKLQDWGYDTIIEGEARGADTLAREEGKRLGFTILPFPANWDKYHKAAGHIRNKEMLEVGKPKLVVAFHKNLSESKGTLNCINQAKELRINTIIVDN